MAVALEFENLVACHHIPHPDRLIVRARYDSVTIRRKCNRRYWIVKGPPMSFKLANLIARLRIPYPYSLVVRPRHDTASIWRKRYRADKMAMALQRLEAWAPHSFDLWSG